MPVERAWTVPEDPQHLPNVELTQDGDLLVQPRVVRDDDYDSLQQTVLEAIAILRHVGGTIQIASQRGEIAPKVVVTESYIFAYNSFTPLVRRLDQPAEQAADLPEPGGDLTAEEIAQHFPDVGEGALGDVVSQAQAEEPAEDPLAAAAVE